jgi:hypothetical protein
MMSWWGSMQKYRAVHLMVPREQNKRDRKGLLMVVRKQRERNRKGQGQDIPFKYMP